MIIEQCQNIEELRPLAERWFEIQNGDDFGLDVDLETIFNDLREWQRNEGTVLVAKNENEPVGLFAVFVVPSFLGNQKIALEKYWFSTLGIAGPKLYIEAIKWSKKNGCSHLITNASHLASEMHDKVCRFLEMAGAKLFETSYIMEL
jgi:hypothetical protein